MSCYNLKFESEALIYWRIWAGYPERVAFEWAEIDGPFDLGSRNDQLMDYYYIKYDRGIR